MSVTASEIKGFLNELELNFKDKGIDSDGDHIFVLGLPADDYEDFDGTTGFMTTLQLREHVDGTGGASDEEINALVEKMLQTNDAGELIDIKNKIAELKSGGGEREYKMFAIYIPRLNFKDHSQDKVFRVLNGVNAIVKCSSLCIDRAGDVTYQYMLIIEDAKMQSEQFKRLLSVVVSSVNEFGKQIKKLDS